MSRSAGATASEMEPASPAATSEEWMLDCVVDLNQPKPEEEPLLELVRIGT